MKKVISLLLVLMLMISLAGCAGEKQPPAGNEGGKPGELSGEVLVWSWDVAAKSLEDAAVEFNKIHPNVKIKIEDLGTEQVYEKLLTRLASKTGLPDVVTMEGAMIATYAAKFPDGFADLTSVVNSEDFLPVKMGEVTYNGKVVAFPWDGAPSALFYRSDLFEAAGIAPDSIKTWDDFIREGKKMDATGVKMLPLAVSKNPTFWEMLYNQTGSFLFDEEGNSTVNDENGMKAGETLKKLYDAGIIFDSENWDGLVTATKSGKIATVPTAVWWAGTLIDEVQESAGNWRVMPLPAVEAGLDFGAVNGGSNVLVPEAAPNKAAAIEFVKFAMTDVKTQINAFSKYGLYPSYKPAYADPVFDQEVEYFGGQKIWKFFADISDKVPNVNYTENYDEAHDYLRDAQARVLLKGEDVKATLDELQKTFVDKFGK